MNKGMEGRLTDTTNKLKLFAFTLDLEADYGDLYEIFKSLPRIEELLSTLHALDVKITVFSVGQIFELFPDVIKIFEKYECEFEPHSYSHDHYNNPDSEFEIVKSKEAYIDYFGRQPKGYRAPQGRISRAGIDVLEKQGFLYDSSVFPSYYPNPFKYLFSNRQAHYYGSSKVMEIPLTSITPFRLTLSVSYIKLLGVDFVIRLCQLFKMPDIICFSSHLHDFIHNETSFKRLSSFWKFIFRRNKYKGIEYCVKFLEYMKKEGYQFCYMSEIYEKHKDRIL